MSDKNTPWVKKYQPKNTSEIQGHNTSVQRVLDYVQNYSKQKKKALLLYGAPGCGKSSLTTAISNELGLELIEVNASDARNKNALDQKIGNALRQQSLFFTAGKLILIDEVDGLSGTYDRGATTEIVNLIKTSKFPILMTANDPWDKKFATLRRNVEMVELKTLSYPSIAIVLKKICDAEGVAYEEDVIKSFARHAGGDLRGSINDLQTICGSKKTLTKEDLQNLSERRQIESMPQSLMKVFKTTDVKLAVSAFEDSNTNQDEQFLWIEENIPLEYDNIKDRATAFDRLSKADVYRGRIRRWQHWRFMVYINFLLTAGVACAKTQKYKKFLTYKKGDRILKMWMAKNSNAKKKSICEKIAAKSHSSSKEIYKNDILFYKMTCKNDKNFADAFAKEFELDKDEIAWINR